ncbi:restriction endonuclease subunit M [Devosia epidermidihirudinis]|uniref:Restriction endonuclease subunit M n=1 Tax=Devosia epidermidihirudinis TaxID=1293439 RepID=A0A0F5QJD0_9HYPH|nr:N-6 DNA methylase [Devosia epidermidihirudinis]KKC41092.1 restriction endonuclease subunit M [Devosia epidermidihirudinis]
MTKFAECRAEFDTAYKGVTHLPKSLVPVRGEYVENIAIRNAAGEPLEEYYKWQFVYSLLHSGLFNKDYVGVEVWFPKGSASSKALQVDLVIFDDARWIDRYRTYRKSGAIEDLQWLRDHMIAVCEFKRSEKGIEKIYQSQLKPAMKEKEPTDSFILGMYYDDGRLYLFQRKNGYCIRLDAAKNLKGEKSAVGDLSLHLPDPYVLLPDMAHLLSLAGQPTANDRSKRAVSDLDLITSISHAHIQSALSHVLRTLDRVGLVNQRGYSLIISALALKIFDEHETDRNASRPLQFFVGDDEDRFSKLSEPGIRNWIDRIKTLEEGARQRYPRIFSSSSIQWTNESQVRAALAVCHAFQDYSFVRSRTSDLYQLVFYNFANQFKRDEAAQFLTPLPVIKFLVSIVNPREGQTVFDPCCGIGDFLSLSYVNSQIPDPSKKLSDQNLFGVDLDESMITLATLNMLLNGDGEARLFHKPGTGSIDWKVAAASAGEPAKLVQLDPAQHMQGKWDEWHDQTELMKFDVVLTNPPFGEDRAFRPQNETERGLAGLYETWGMPGTKEGLDLGILFLENAYRVLDDYGRVGFILSNSIASVSKWRDVRTWFSQKMRLVAIFDLPANVFAETGVNTSVLVAYKPPEAELKRLQKDGYSVFCRDIKKVGYERRTRQRNVFFNPIYRLNPVSFEVEIDLDGNPALDEEFSQIVRDFRNWALGQEEALSRVFVQ